MFMQFLATKFLDKYSQTIRWSIYTRMITHICLREFKLYQLCKPYVMVFDRTIRVQLECCAIGICIESTILRTWPWRCQEKAARKGRPWTCLPCDPRLLVYPDDRYLCTSFRWETVNIEPSFPFAFPRLSWSFVYCEATAVFQLLHVVPALFI